MQQEFKYTGVNSLGSKVSGTIKASSINVAKAKLRRQGLKKIKISKNSLTFLTKSRNEKISSKDIAFFIRQMSTMVKAGLPIVQSFEVIIESSSSNPGLLNLIRTIKSDVESGSSFAEALKKHPKHFDELLCNLINAGEQSGTLDIMLSRVSSYREKSEALRKKIKKATYYPMGVLVVAFVVTTILLIKVVPTFEEMFKGFGADLPAFTRLVLQISEVLQKNGSTMFIGIGISVFAFIYFKKTNSKFKYFAESMVLKIPMIGQIIKKSIFARFARTLATTFDSGIPLTEALDYVATSTGNAVYEQSVIFVKESVIGGQTLNNSIKATGLYPSVLVQMTGIGEESGSLGEMLDKVASIYEEEVDNSVDGLSTLIEPVIMAFLALIVGGLMIAMYLPIFKMGSVV